MLQQPAETRAAADFAVVNWRRLTGDEPIPQPLLRPLLVIVLDVLPHQEVQVLLTEDEEVVDALDLNRLDEPLDLGVEVG